MAKAKAGKARKPSDGGAQSHLRARMSYLYKASSYLQSISSNNQATPQQQDIIGDKSPSKESSTSNFSRLYNSHMRGVSQKTRCRIPLDVKRTVCKRCDSLLVPGQTCTETVENNSRCPKKPWADVRVVCCNACATERRYPQNAKRSLKLAQRRSLNGGNDGIDTQKSTSAEGHGAVK